MITQLLRLYAQHQILVKHSLRDSQAALPHPVTDTRDFKAGDCFIAIKGEHFDGHDFIPEAQKMGAGLSIGEKGEVSILVTDSRKATALYAKLYFDDPSRDMKLYGITGTNGKTTASLMLYQILLQKGLNVAWIGTLGYKVLNRDFPTRHTTPDILQLNEILSKMRREGVTHVVMEVSSHALALDRVYALEYDVCLFSNLSRDHLDFHRDMEDYFEAKYLLFERAAKASATCIINTDDSYGRILTQRLAASRCRVIRVGHEDSALLRIQNQRTGLASSSFELVDQTKGTRITIQSPLIGDFNVDNLALACAATLECELSMAELPALCQNLKPVRGRIEAVENDLGFGLYIDYAHSPDAIANLLKSLQHLPHQRIITIIGAGGNRDQGKRPLMLKAALSKSDVVIISDDNPRNENPDKIIHEIVRETDIALPWWIIRDRSEAIRSAIRLAQAQDIVVICGKGHESYQEIQGIRYDFDDLKAAKTAVNQLQGEKAEDELILSLDPLLIRILNGEEPVGEGYKAPSSYRYVSTDSRSIKSGSVFFAITGESFDGNSFVSDALVDPANLAVGKDQGLKQNNLIKCEHPELLMARIMQKYLQLFDIYKIALTGSTGKTSAKELLAQVLSARARVLKTQRNENNIYGLCKTILRVKPQCKYGVFEIGTNHFGEIALLADTIKPDAGIILNIGPSHLQYFGDEDGVFKEKSELFHRALELRIFPADDQRFDSYQHDGISVGFAEHANYRIQDRSVQQGRQEFTLAGKHWQIPYAAPHYVINSAFAIAIALELKLEDSEIQAALSTPVSLELRMQIERVQDRHLIIDCYNANPVSMQSAIEFWRDYEPQLPHIAILGDMLELGESSEMYHQMIGAIVAESGNHTIYTVGDHSRFYQDLPSAHFASSRALADCFPSVPDQAVILIKASHGIHLEEILPLLRGEN
jgi:UDP-N-acetylmuramyl-tripeptide synthetase/UDP-N-acetylmuramoyl-tripeptide--D-alanyl-D-alanine ligase